MEWAASQAGCDEFIARFPQGYDTNAGDAGARLSGGERQRIAIARAILKNAPIVILDEATAFTDPENEDKLQQSIDRLTQGKTLIVIAHRLSTIMYADQILVLEDGQITARGTHEQLLTSSETYLDMWKRSYQRHGLEHESGGEQVMLKIIRRVLRLSGDLSKRIWARLRLRIFRIHVRSAAHLRSVLRFEPITERPWNYRPDLGHRPGD